MITFKQYITEARMAPLYHATNIQRAVTILHDDKLKAYRPSEPGIPKATISFTRNLDFAFHWALSGVVLELDQQKLAQRYKIVPYNFFSAQAQDVGAGDWALARYPLKDSASEESRTKGNRVWEFRSQFEEKVIAKEIFPLSRYLKRIIITESKLKWLGNDIEYRTIINHPLLYNYTKSRWVNK